MAAMVGESGKYAAFGWDGHFRGKEILSAVYVYWLEAIFTDGEVLLFQGDFSLIR